MDDPKDPAPILPRERGPMEVDGGVGDSPLRPEEQETYGTETEAGAALDEDEAPALAPGAEPRPWIAIGLVLLAVFFAILVWAVLLPILG